MAHNSYADHSRDNYGIPDNVPASLDQLKFGALARIATALERMAQPYVNLLDRVDYLDRRLKEEAEERRMLNRRIIALRGVVTRTKNRKARRG